MAKKVININVSEVFYKVLSKEARYHKMTISGYLRYLVIKDIIDKEEFGFITDSEEGFDSEE